MNDIAQFSTLAALIIGGGAQGADKASNFHENGFPCRNVWLNENFPS
jgi:ketol-acid reductoisomerase